jgi:hypothetical protein
MIILLASGSRMRAAQPSWSSPVGLQYSMPVYLSVVDSNNTPLTNSGNLVAIFNGSTIAGVLSNPVVIGGKSVYQGTIWSTNATNSGFTAQFYNASSDGVWSLTNLITFSSGSGTNFSSYGSVSNPVTSVASPQTQTLAFPALAGVTYSNGLTIGLGATSSSGLSVSYGSASTNVSLAGTNVTVLGAGTASIVASQAGNSNYAAAPPVTNALVIAKATPAFSIDSNSLNVVYTGGSAAVALVNAGGIPYVITYNGSTNLPVAAGTYTVLASVSDTNNYTAYSVTNTLVIARSSTNTITFPSLGGVTYSNGLTVGLGATASSGLSVSYSSASTNVSISGTNVTVLGAGTASIVASQAGNSNYVAATPVTNTLVVGKASATVTITGTNATYDGTAKSVTVGTTPSGLSNSVTYNGSGTVPTNAGSYSVVATVSDANYTGSNTATLTIAQAGNTITFPSLGSVSTSSGPITLTATASSGLSVSYSSGNTGVATVSGSTLTVVGAGTATIVANQAGNGNYAAATPVTNTLVVTNAVSSAPTPTNATGSYNGNSVIYVTGSASFRRAANSYLFGKYGGNLYASDKGATNDVTAGNLYFTNCVVNGSTNDIAVSWWGSEAGIQSAASGTNATANLPFFDYGKIGNNGSNASKWTGRAYLGVDGYAYTGSITTNSTNANTSLQKGGVVFSETVQTISPFTTAKGYRNLTSTKVAVVPMSFYANRGAGVTNISTLVINQLLSSGVVYGNLWSGNIADKAMAYWLVGGYPDSGARLTAHLVAKAGALSSALQFNVNAASGVVTNLDVTPAGVINGVSVAKGNNGYVSGETLVGRLTNTLGTSSLTVTDSDTNATLSFSVPATNYLIGYAASGDASAVSNNVVPLAYNGVTGRFGTTSDLANGTTYLDAGYTNIINGVYPFWAYEYVLYDGGTTNTGGVTAAAKYVATNSAAVIKTWASTNANLAPNINLNEMKVNRTADGGPIKNN